MFYPDRPDRQSYDYQEEKAIPCVGGLVLGTTAEAFLAALTSYAMAPRIFQVTVLFREEGLL